MTVSMDLVLGVMSHALNNATLSPLLGGPIDLSNRVGRAMTNMHEWRYMRRADQTIDTVQGADFAVLPGNFLSLEHLIGSQSLGITVTPTTLMQIITMRSFIPVLNASTFFAAVETVDGATSDAPPVDRLALYPEPGSSNPAAFRIIYRSTWIELDEDAKKVPIPTYIEELFLQCIREIAMGYEGTTLDGTMPSIQDRVDRLRAGSIFMDAQAQDSRTQKILGPSTGGHLESWRFNRDWDTGQTLSVS